MSWLGAALIAAGASFGAQAAEPPQPKFAELTPVDRLRLDRQRALVAGEAAKRYGAAKLTRSAADMPILQRLVDDRVFARTQTYELQALGVAFGDVLAADLGLRWIIVTDEYGTDPTLRYRETSLQVNALTMISKRVEDGKPVDLEAIRQGVRAHVTEMLRSGDYR